MFVRKILRSFTRKFYFVSENVVEESNISISLPLQETPCISQLNERKPAGFSLKIILKSVQISC